MELAAAAGRRRSRSLVAYLPYLSVGSGVFGFLWGYVEEEGFASGRGFNSLWLLEQLTGPCRMPARSTPPLLRLSLHAWRSPSAFRTDRSDARVDRA